MKILLVCAGGMSTGLLMKKMEVYWQQNGKELTITAVGLNEYDEVYKNYEIILVGPQVAYRLNQIKADTNMPCAVIQSMDYALANCPNIMKPADQLYAQK